MPYFKVNLRRDAWVNYSGVIEAKDADDAAAIALRTWKEDTKEMTLEESDMTMFDHVECDGEDDCEEITAVDYETEKPKSTEC